MFTDKELADLAYSNPDNPSMDLKTRCRYWEKALFQCRSNLKSQQDSLEVVRQTAMTAIVESQVEHITRLEAIKQELTSKVAHLQRQVAAMAE